VAVDVVQDIVTDHHVALSGIDPGFLRGTGATDTAPDYRATEDHGTAQPCLLQQIAPGESAFGHEDSL
jgi:hypothetical protein